MIVIFYLYLHISEGVIVLLSNKVIILISLIFLLIIQTSNTQANEGKHSLVYQVKSVESGSNILLEDGRKIRLADVITPYHLQINNYEAKIQKHLSNLLEGKFVSVEVNESKKTDRFGRLLAHVWVYGNCESNTVDSCQKRVWVQGNLVENGYAIVYNYSQLFNYNLALLTLEYSAREQFKGVWQEQKMTVLDTRTVEANSSRYRNSFKFIEGVPTQIVESKNKIYINFGEDWKKDFTITVDKAYKASIKEYFGGNLTELEGKKVIVRGWVEYYNGPMIRLVTPSQIQVKDNIKIM